MNKKFLSAILFGALMVTSTGTFVSCKDYDDDIDNVQSQVDTNASAISTLTSQLSSLQTALSTAQATADAAKAAAAAAQTEAEKAAKLAESAAAQAKADAIAEATKQVEALKVWVEAQDYVTQEELAAALAPIAGKIEGIENGLSEIWVYINETLTLADQTSLMNIMTLQEQLDVQEAAIKNMQEALANSSSNEALNSKIAEVNAKIEEINNELSNLIGQTSLTLSNFITDYEKALAELIETNNVQDGNINYLTKTLENLINIHDEDITALWNEISGEDANSVRSQLGSLASVISNIQAELVTLKTRLTSMLFAPSFYVDGIEAIPFKTLKYTPWEDLKGDKADGKTDVTLSDGSTKANYYVSPSNIDTKSIDTLLVLLNDASNISSRAASASVTATIDTLVNGKLTVNLKKNTAEAFGGLGDEFKVMALQAVLKAEEGETAALVTSDWARIFEGHYLPQIHAVNEKVEEPHLWSYTQGIAAKEGELIIAESDYTTAIDLNELVTVCLTDIDASATESLTKLSAEEVKAYGMKFGFKLVEEYVLIDKNEEETQQSKFAILDENGILTPCAITGALNNADAIGREPLVQVVLNDTVNNKVVDVNYFKVKWTPITNSVELGAYEPAFEDVFACGGEYVKVIGTPEMNTFFYTALNMSKEQFHNTYRPDNYPNGFIIRDAEGKEVTDMGTIKQITAKGSTTTYNIEWTYTQGEITKAEFEAGEVVKTAYLTYVNKVNPAETITFNVTLKLEIKGMGVAAGYVQTYWNEGAVLSNTNADKMFQVNPALTSDKAYGKDKYETCRIITNMLHGYNKTGIAADDLTIKDIVNENVAGAEFVFDAERAALMNEDWTVSEDGTILYVDGEAAAAISVVNEKAYIKLYESDHGTWNIASEAAKTLVGKKVPVKLVGTHCTENKVDLDKFLVHFIEPLAATLTQPTDKLQDLYTPGSTIDIRTVITVSEKFGMKRPVVYVNEEGKLAVNAELNAWYAVEPSTWDLENAMTNLNIDGHNLVITDAFDTKFSEHADKYKLSVVKNEAGYPTQLKFENNSGSHIQQAFKVRIPVYVATKWNSKLTAEPNYVEVEIVPGVTE